MAWRAKTGTNVPAQIPHLIGVYGTVARTVAAGSREIRIRISLGSRPSAIIRLVVRQGIWGTLNEVVLGLATASLGPQWLAGQFFGASHSNLLIYVGVPLLLWMVTLLACYLLAHRATRVDPMVALRYE